MLIEVVYAGPDAARTRVYRMEASATVADALRLAAADPVFSGVDFEHCGLGLFGAIVDPRQPLEEGDRVEIYRALAVDPKNARRRRAAALRATPRAGRAQ